MGCLDPVWQPDPMLFIVIRIGSSRSDRILDYSGPSALLQGFRAGRRSSLLGWTEFAVDYGHADSWNLKY